MNDPKRTMQSLLQHLKRSEIELSASLALFKDFPSKSKNGAKRMDALIKALHVIQKHQFDLPRDWEQSTWFDDSEHHEYLRTIEESLGK